jgi:hypothetical protein
MNLSSDSFSSEVNANTATASPEHIHSEPADNLVLSQIATAETEVNTNCVTSDQHGNVWVCNPGGGSIIRVIDRTVPE